MSTPQFLEWLDEKFAQHATGKLVPPLLVMKDQLSENVRERLENSTREKILGDNQFDEQVSRAYVSLLPEIGEAILSLEENVKDALEMNPEQKWTEPIDEIASDLIDSETEVS